MKEDATNITINDLEQNYIKNYIDDYIRMFGEISAFKDNIKSTINSLKMKFSNDKEIELCKTEIEMLYIIIRHYKYIETYAKEPPMFKNRLSRIEMIRWINKFIGRLFTYYGFLNLRNKCTIFDFNNE